MEDLKKYTTEGRNPNTMNLDEMSALEIATAMNNEDKRVLEGISEILPEIAKAIDTIAAAFENGGRLIYFGAGTSGRLGVLDASECPPTYGVSKDQVVGIIAGGDNALRNAAEGAEDSKELAVEDLKKLNISEKDVVVGIAASGRTPYVIGGLEYAGSLNAKTIAIACNKNSKIGEVADIALEAVAGPEVLTGSTRLKAGTTQKLILNMLSTGSMVRTGKAYQNLMVNVVQSNKKLEARAENIVMDSTGVDRATARKFIDEADGSVKLAIVMILTNSDVERANELLKQGRGHVKQAIKAAQ